MATKLVTASAFASLLTPGASAQGFGGPASFDCAMRKLAYEFGQQLLPPLMVPSPTRGDSAAASQSADSAGSAGGGKVAGTSLLSCSSSSLPAAGSRPIVTAVAAAKQSPLAVATVATAQPVSPAQLAMCLASTYEQATSLLEQALKPLSPMRAQMSADVAAELTAQLNATRLAVQACQRLAAA